MLQERVYKTACNCESCIQNDHKQGQNQSLKQRKKKCMNTYIGLLYPVLGWLAGWIDRWING